MVSKGLRWTRLQVRASRAVQVTVSDQKRKIAGMRLQGSDLRYRIIRGWICAAGAWRFLSQVYKHYGQRLKAERREFIA